MFNIDFLQILGSFLAIKGILLIIKFIWVHGIGNWLNGGVEWRGNHDNWAIITGSTDGLGLQFALEMAKKGYKLLLISRNATKLEDTKTHIRQLVPDVKQIRCLTIDFCFTDVYETIEHEVKTLEGEVHVLINNVGMTYDDGQYFGETSVDFIEKMVNVNVLAATRLSRLIIPMMLKNNSGIIINIATVAGLFENPYFCMYSATKAYLINLTRSIQFEYQDTGLTIQLLLPGFVRTKMLKMLKHSYFISPSSEYVSQAVQTIGLAKETTGHWLHTLIQFSNDVFLNLVGINTITINKLTVSLLIKYVVPLMLVENYGLNLIRIAKKRWSI